MNSREPSYDDQAVERGARALWNRGRAAFWEEAPESAREHYRAEARDVLAAALAQQPVCETCKVEGRPDSFACEHCAALAQQAQPEMPTRALDFTEALLVDAYLKPCTDPRRAEAWAKYDVARIRDGDYIVPNSVRSEATHNNRDNSGPIAAPQERQHE